MGRQARTKQADPTPLSGSSSHPQSGAYVGKKKQKLEQRSLGDGAQKSSGGLKKGPKRQSQQNGGDRQPKKSKKSVKIDSEPEYDEDDIEGLKEQDDWSGSEEQDEAFAKIDEKHLEAARRCVEQISAQPEEPLTDLSLSQRIVQRRRLGGPRVGS